jgi:branched-subunit amino acid aminotransferase/4-amino-4-deoxychorismate lyase
MRVIIDGKPVDDDHATIPIYDWGLQRGFGVFEVIRSYGGQPFRMEQHLDRLERSAAALVLDLPPRPDLASWITTCAEEGDDCQVRVVVTGGSRDPLAPSAPRTIVLWEPCPEVPDRLAILPMKAPWHPGTDSSGFYGVKWTSYAPNMASTDKARRAGFDDALLLTTDGIVLEGPTFTVAWVSEGRLETPTLELGILASVTRDVLCESARRLGMEVKQGFFPLARLLEADEAFGLSTVKQVTPIAQVGEYAIAVGPTGAALASGFAAIVAAETGAPPAAS